MPAAAVQRGPQGVFTFVVKPDNTIEMRPIKVSAANTGGPTAVIDSGLTAGEQVVVDGQLKLRPGVTVKATPPAAPGASPGTPAAPPAAAAPAKK